MATTLMANGPTDAQTRWYLETLRIEGARVVDVGANVGHLSEFFVRHGAHDVLSVEPLADNLATLRARIAASDAGTRWTVAPCAASSHDGTLLLRVGQSEGTPHNSVAVVDQRVPLRDGLVRVPCRTLSSLCREATIVKLDIEGHEYVCLDEALPVLTKVRAWAIELHMMPGRPLSGVTKALRERGYEVLGAGRARNDPAHRWISAPVPPGMEWDSVPVARHLSDGSVFKMLHLIARR